MGVFEVRQLCAGFVAAFLSLILYVCGKMSSRGLKIVYSFSEDIQESSLKNRVIGFFLQ